MSCNDLEWWWFHFLVLSCILSHSMNDLSIISATCSTTKNDFADDLAGSSFRMLSWRVSNSHSLWWFSWCLAKGCQSQVSFWCRSFPQWVCFLVHAHTCMLDLNIKVDLIRLNFSFYELVTYILDCTLNFSNLMGTVIQWCLRYTHFSCIYALWSGPVSSM